MGCLESSAPPPSVCDILTQSRLRRKLWQTEVAATLAQSRPCPYPPGFVEPRLPPNGRTAPTGAQWAYEIKRDGFRFICRRNGERVRLFSRGGHDWSAQLPTIVEAMRAFSVTSVTLNGEVVGVTRITFLYPAAR